MKICIKCEVVKELSEFYKNKINKDGHSGKCKDCTKCAVKLYRENNLEKVKGKVNEYREKNKEAASDYNKKWREENKEYKKERDKEYREKNKEVLKEKNKKYHEDNKEVIKEKKKKYRKENIEIIKEKGREYARNNKEKRNERHRNRMENDELYKLSCIIRSSIRKPFTNNKFPKKSKVIDILGCSFEEFKLYLESKFEDWMSWENWGLYNGELNYGWDMDHKIPISSAETEEDIIRLSHYTNFQPLCSYTNRYIKKDNY